MEIYAQIASILGLLILNAVFVTCEFSIIKIRFSHFDEALSETIRQRRSLTKLYDNANNVIRMIRLGLIVCGVMIGIWFYLVFGPILGNVVALGVWSGIVGNVLAVTLAIAMRYVFADAVPRALALHYPLAAFKIAAPVIRALWIPALICLTILRPFARGILRIFRVPPGVGLDSLALEAQLEAIEDSEKTPSPLVRNMIRGALQIRKLEVSDVLLPRNQVQYFDTEDTTAANLAMARETGHTRFPLCEGDLDRCIGIIHIKDIFRFRGSADKVDLRKIARTVVRVRMNDALDMATETLLKRRVHMALVVDEFGGTVGLLTLERALEEIVGDIQDEFDTEEEDLIQPVADPTGREAYVVSGLTPIHDVEEHFQIEVDNDEVSTVSGLITTTLGRIPDPGESVETDGLYFEVTKVEETRVVEANVWLAETDEDEDEDEKDDKA